MAYQGGAGDERIIQRGAISPELPLPPGDAPPPLPHAKILAQTAHRLGLSPENATVRREIDQRYTRISPGHVIPTSRVRSLRLQRYDARFHPAHFSYAAGARTRIVAHLAEHPDWWADRWSAAALYGVGDFSDGADACVRAGGDRLPASSPLQPMKRRRPPELAAWRVYETEQPLWVVPPLFALISCLKSTLAGEHRWYTPQLAGLAPERLRAIQVVDRFRRVLGVSPTEIAAAGRDRILRRSLARVIAQSSPGTDSPPETILRIIANRAVARTGFAFTPQVPVRVGGRLVTVLDLAVEPLRVGLMFDGAQHWGKARREKDARINVLLDRSGWRILRVSHGMFDDVAGLTDLLADLIDEALTRPRAEPGHPVRPPEEK